MRKIFVKRQLRGGYEIQLLENVRYSEGIFHSHEDVARHVEDRHPFTITIIVENLKPDLWNKKDYVRFTRVPTEPRYRELLFQYFFREFGTDGGNRVYAEWLKKYRSRWESDGKVREIDEYVIEHELESRYGSVIQKKYKNVEKLKRSRYRLERKRYYHLPEPFSKFDWRNPYDNIFIWEEDGGKVARRGGSGGSWQREQNSKFIFGFSLINQKRSIPSYLFIYTSKNQLLFVRKFSALCVPVYDIGSNYFLSPEEEKEALRSARFLKWNFLAEQVREVAALSSYDERME